MKIQNIKDVTVFFKIIDDVQGTGRVSFSGRRPHQLKIPSLPVSVHGYDVLQRIYQRA